MADTVIYETQRPRPDDAAPIGSVRIAGHLLLPALSPNRSSTPPALGDNHRAPAVHAAVTEPWLQRRGLVNYWGYSTAGYFAPNRRYAASRDPVDEFKQMVKVLHREGFEVILDVVHNHTAEGNHQGATLCFRGLDNPGFYVLDPADRRRYVNWTGTGNTVDLTSPWALRLAMDSLRYWVQEMHVDGFRFDLATTLGRAPQRFDAGAAFFLSIQQDPVLRDVKLIAEPWDLGPDSYQLGTFHCLVGVEGRYRDELRDFWRGVRPGRHDGREDHRQLRHLCSRGPLASINFTPPTTGSRGRPVSYNQKHNQANREHTTTVNAQRPGTRV